MANSHIPKRLGLLPLAISMAYSTNALAQDWLEEVVVTAQKRSESVQDVPIAINALTGDQLGTLGVFSSNDIVNLFPSLSKNGASTVNSGFSIRGVGTKNFFPNAEQSVGQYLDEVSLPIASSSQLGIFDLERIEVLAGPQNALFGRNTTGGAVNFITVKPTLDGELNGYANVKLGNEERYDFEGATDIELSDSVGLRLSFQSVNRGGVYDNLFNGSDIGEFDRNSGRVTFLWEASEDTTITANIHVGKSDGEHAPIHVFGSLAADGVNPCPEFLEGGADNFDRNTGCISPVPHSTTGEVEEASGDFLETFEAGPNVSEVELEGGFFRVDHSFGFADLVSITAFDKYTINFAECSGQVPSGFSFCPGFDTDQEVFSQEVRLTSTGDGPLRWLTGVYYSDQDDDITQTILSNVGAFGEGPEGLARGTRLQQDVEIFSAYGQVDFDIIDELTLTVALRFTSDDKDGTSSGYRASFTDTGLPDGTPLPFDTYLDLSLVQELTARSGSVPNVIDVEQDLEEWGGKVGLTYTVNDDLLTYVSYSRGFKSGSFDLRFTNPDPADPEFIDAYEIGVKSTLLDGTLVLNSAIYYYLWDDRQQFSNAQDGSNQPIFVNIPEADLLGFEVESKWSPSDDWYIQLGLAYSDTEITDSDDILGVTEGADLSNSPQWSVTGLVIKTIDTDFGQLSLQTNFKWNDEFETGLLGITEQRNTEDVFLLGARASMSFGDNSQYEVALWGENLTEEIYCEAIAFNPGTRTNGCVGGTDGMAFYGIDAKVHF